MIDPTTGFLAHQETKTEEGANPWNVKSFDDFLFYVCPECNYLTKEADSLVDHASELHIDNYSKTLWKGHKVVIQDQAIEYEPVEVSTSDIDMQDIPVTAKQKEDLVDGLDIKHCSYCDSTFDSQHALLKHLVNSHDIVKEFCCDICDFSAPLSSDLDKHKVTNHKPEDFSEFIDLQWRKDIEEEDTDHNYSAALNQDNHGSVDVSMYETDSQIVINPVQEVVYIKGNEIRSTNVAYSEKQKLVSKTIQEVIFMKNTTKNTLPKSPLPKLMSEELDNHGIHECYICENKSYTDKDEFIKHVEANHMKTSDHRCNECAIVLLSYGNFSDYYALLEHKVTLHGRKMVLECYFCTQLFSLPSALKKHLNRVHQCLGSGIKKRNYKLEHQQRKERKIYGKEIINCYNCNPLYQADESDKEKHLQECPTQCYFCGYVSKERTNVMQHVKDNHFSKENGNIHGYQYCIGPIMRPSLKCLDCNHIYQDAWQKAIHICGEEDPKWFGNSHKENILCGKCNQNVESYRKYKGHQLEHRNKNEKFNCDLCDFKTVLPSVFCSHVKLHKESRVGDVPNVKLIDTEEICNVCNMIMPKFFIKLHQKKDHLMIHCEHEQCNFSTKDDAELKIHKQSHVQFKCNMSTCKNISFHDKEELKAHSSQHTLLEGQELCDICYNIFSISTRHKANAHKIFTSKCNRCSMVNMDIEEMKLHTSRCSKLKESDEICDICYNIFREKFVDAHKARVHKLIGEFPCLHCNYIAPSQMTLAKHLDRNHSGETSAKCDTCDKTFKNALGLQIHFQNVHSTKYFHCYKCGIAFKKQAKFEKHLIQEHQTVFICSVCEEMCSSKKGLIQHINEKHAIECSETGYHICSLCREVQSSCDELNLHFHQEHKVPLDHECNKCNKKFSTKLFLTIHTMELHEFDLDSNSMTNNISIATALNIKDVKVIEDKVIERNFECQECGKKLKSQRVLDLHFRQLHQPWTHNHFCHLCSWSTFEKYKLKKHYGEKHGTGEYNCKLCTFKCSSYFQSKRHRKIHFNDHRKRAKCSECESSFEKKSNLASHMWKEHRVVFKYNKK